MTKRAENIENFAMYEQGKILSTTADDAIKHREAAARRVTFRNAKRATQNMIAVKDSYLHELTGLRDFGNLRRKKFHAVYARSNLLLCHDGSGFCHLFRQGHHRLRRNPAGQDYKRGGGHA